MGLPDRLGGKGLKTGRRFCENCCHRTGEQVWGNRGCSRWTDTQAGVSKPAVQGDHARFQFPLTAHAGRYKAAATWHMLKGRWNGLRNLTEKVRSSGCPRSGPSSGCSRSGRLGRLDEDRSLWSQSQHPHREAGADLPSLSFRPELPVCRRRALPCVIR